MTASGKRGGLLVPDLYYTSVHAIDLEGLNVRGVDSLLVDLDNTLLPRDTNEVPPELVRWSGLLKQRGFSACLVSNNWHGYVSDVARELGFEIVPKALKPLPRGFRAGMQLLGTVPQRSAVVGDQLFTDVLGGNIVGCTTVLVSPLSATDLPHTLFLRLIERLLLSDREPLA